MRVVVADDVMLVRSGLARLLMDAGIDVVGEAADADELLDLVERAQPDVAIVDIRMPPTHTDEGLLAARRIRERHPGTAVVLLSQYLEPRYAERLLRPAARRPRLPAQGARLRHRGAGRRAASGDRRRVRPRPHDRVAADAAPAAELAAGPAHRPRARGPRADGRGPVQRGIARELGVSERTVEAVCAQVFLKLQLEPSPDVNRRVSAVLVLRPPLQT